MERFSKASNKFLHYVTSKEYEIAEIKDESSGVNFSSVKFRLNENTWVFMNCSTNESICKAYIDVGSYSNEENVSLSIEAYDNVENFNQIVTYVLVDKAVSYTHLTLPTN